VSVADGTAAPAVNRVPERFAVEGYCFFPRTFDDSGVAANRALLDEAIESGMLQRPNYLLEPHTLDQRWLDICRHPGVLGAVAAALGPNLILIHDSFLLHGSGTNRTERRRAGYTIRYCSTDTTWLDVDQHPIPVYLVRGEAGARGERYVDVRR